MGRELLQRLPGALPLAALALLWSCASSAQMPVDDHGNPIEPLEESAGTADAALEEEVAPLTPEELEALVGPIALYPDKLLAIVLPASTYPLEIVQAARFLEQLEDDDSLKPDESWDDSVTALLNYPEVVRMMNDDIDWTWRLGEAVVRQQTDVIAAVESFRDRAYAAGNLKTDDRQQVSNNGGAITIDPVEEDVIYVPYYEPERVITYQPRQVYYYYPRPYPVYYYPYPAHHSFTSGYFWGVTTAFGIGWTNHHLHVFHHSYWGHPYYGHQYFGHYYRRPSITVYNTYYPNSHRDRSHDHHRYGDYWRPRDGGARPGHYRARLERFRDGPRARSREGYRNDGALGRVATENRAGFRGESRATPRSNVAREGFAASRDRQRDASAAERRQRAASNASDARQPGSARTNREPIRFRSREGTAAPQNRIRSAGDAARVPDRSATSRLAERRATRSAEGPGPGDDSQIRFRSRSRETANPSGSAPAATRSSTSLQSGARDRSAAPRVRAAQPPRASSPARSGSAFSSSAGRSAPAARPDVSRPSATPAPRTAAPRAVQPQPRRSASPASRAPRAAPPSAPRESRAAPRRGSGASSSNRRIREH